MISFLFLGKFLNQNTLKTQIDQLIIIKWKRQYVLIPYINYCICKVYINQSILIYYTV